MTTTQQETAGQTPTTPQQAVTLLIQGVQIAQQRGAYQLNEAGVLSNAVSFLTGTPTSLETLQSAVTATEESEESEESEETTEE